MNAVTGLGRRHFLSAAAAVTGGLTMGIGLPDPAKAATATPAEVGIWVTIGTDDSVTVRIARSEMGQGTLTGLAQLVADELDANWAKVTAEYVTPEANLARKQAWGTMSTGGSTGIRGSVAYVRKGGAAARAMLIEAAAQRWKVPASECTASDSVITHKSGKKLRYGEVAADAAKLPVPDDVVVKDPKAWKIIGKGVKRLDTREKLNGSLQFAIDVQLPGMLNATIAQCPVFGGKLKSFDAAKIKSMPGVRHVLQVDDVSVAVVADKFYQAKTALARLPIQWDEGPNAKISSADIADRLKEGGLQHTVPQSRRPGADELHREGGERHGGNLGWHPERRCRAGRRGGGRWGAAGQCEGAQASPRRRFWSQGAAGRDAAGGFACQAVARRAGEADLDA